MHPHANFFVGDQACADKHALIPVIRVVKDVAYSTIARPCGFNTKLPLPNLRNYERVSILGSAGQLYMTIQNSGNVTGRFTTQASTCCTSPYGYNGSTPSCGASSAMASIGGPVSIMLAPGAQAMVSINISAHRYSHLSIGIRE